ncbi:MAG: ATP-binding cassette domain-containing protein, partial [Bacteroidales bacterium]|nr:ATP-binding cassette domain-containing protein [Bacteroidales bacterium]
MEILNIEGISKAYGANVAVKNLSLKINRGEVYGILGPNGSGKTTTLGIILGVVRSDSGYYEWNYSVNSV